MDIQKFVDENKMVVKLMTGDAEYNPQVVELIYTKKIGDNDENVRIICDFIKNPRYRRILWVAPTASGKTYTTAELMDMLHAYLVAIFCPSKIQNIQNGNNPNYQMQCVIGGVELDKTDVNEKLRLSAVYDKSSTVLEEVYRRARKSDAAPVIFVDEAHVLTESYEFRKNAVNALQELTEDVVDVHGGKIIYITATPDQLKNIQVDLIINCVPTNYVPMAKKMTVLETSSGETYTKVLFEQIVKMVNAGKIPFVRLNDKDAIDELQKRLATMGIISESVSGDDKTYSYDEAMKTITYDNIIYSDVVAKEQLPRYTRNNERIQCYICTSVLEAGTNITKIGSEINTKLTPVFCVDARNTSPDAIEQFFNRIRYQVSDCVIITNNGNYNDAVTAAIQKISSLQNVSVDINDDMTYFKINTTDSKSFNKICASCNKSDVFYTKYINEVVDKKTGKTTTYYRVDITKKSFVELEQIVSEQITKNRENYEILNSIYTGLKLMISVDDAITKINDILKTPTVSGVTNSQGIVKINENNELYIDNTALWKSAHDLYTKQNYFIRDVFYNTLRDRLGITNISIEKAESLNINMKEIKDIVKLQTLEILKKEIDNNEDLLQEILDGKKVENLKSIEKTSEYKNFIKFVKINHNISAAYNIVRDSNKSGCDKLYNEVLKERMKTLSATEKNCLEKLANMDEPDYTIVKNEESLGNIKIVTESGYWNLIKMAVNAGIAVNKLVDRIMNEKDEEEAEEDDTESDDKKDSKNDIEIYVKKAVAVKFLKAVDYDFTKLGNTIVEKEIKTVLNMFYTNFKQKTIKDSDLVKLQNALNKQMKSISNTYYTKRHAKNLIMSVFKTRIKDGVLSLRDIAKAAK